MSITLYAIRDSGTTSKHWPETAVWNAQQAARRLGISPGQFDRLVATGALPVVRLPGVKRLRKFRPADVEALFVTTDRIAP